MVMDQRKRKTSKGSKEEIPNGQKKRLVRAWYDPDDEKRDADGLKFRKTKLEAKEDQPYKARLREDFELTFGPTPSWARLDKLQEKKQSDESDEDEAPASQSYKNKFRGLKIIKLQDLNACKRAEGAIIRSVGFHPKNSVGLVAGDSVVSLYQVDGGSDGFIQSVSFDNFSIRKAQFSIDGEEIYASSGRISHFYSYDMRSGAVSRVRPCHATKDETIRKLVVSPDDKIIVTVGHGGQMYLYSKTSKEIIDKISISGEVKDVAFSPDGSEMFAYGDVGEIYRWNMNTRRCVEKFCADGAFDGSCLGVSSKYIACGSSTGFVSMLENKFEQLKENEILSCRTRKPIGELKNLQTGISCLAFNSTQEALLMGSIEKENAFRLVELPSLNVVQGFPYVNANYGRLNSAAFSPNSGYLSIGNNKGCAYLFRLKNYDNY